MRLPCILRNHYIGKEKYKITWHVPAGKDQFAVRFHLHPAVVARSCASVCRP